MARKNLPGYLLHKRSGQAVVVLNGKTIYLGKYKSKASREEYENVIADFIANGKKLPPTRTKSDCLIETLCYDYLDNQKKVHSKNGKPTEAFGHCRLAVAPVIKHYGQNSIPDFGSRSLLFIQAKWEESGIARKTINRWTGIIKDMFRWGVVYELVEAEILQPLLAVPNLKVGKTSAPEYDEIPPIEIELVEKTLPFLPQIVADMVRVQLYAGMRPQDVRNLRSCDIDRSREDVWKYSPYTHKTKNKGKTRELAIGPRAQAVLTPYLESKADTPEAFLFSPRDTVQMLQDERRKNRKSKVQPSQICRKRANPKSLPREQYSKDSYGQAVTRACEKAGVEPWSPNQLRHTTGSVVRDQYDLDHAQAVLGHSSAKTTEIYAKVSFEKAAEVMREIG